LIALLINYTPLGDEISQKRLTRKVTLTNFNH